jgi:hypothetical protein
LLPLLTRLSNWNRVDPSFRIRIPFQTKEKTLANAMVPLLLKCDVFAGLWFVMQICLKGKLLGRYYPFAAFQLIKKFY